MGRILITGATGFVGRRLAATLADKDRHSLMLATRRRPSETLDGSIRTVAVGEIGPLTDWAAALDGCDTVVHLAAQTPGRGVPDDVFVRINEQGTARLAEQAAGADVRKFIFLSSLHAITGGSSDPIVTDGTVPRPGSAYGRSKLAAEAHVERLRANGVVAVSLRPPLVIGAQAVGNWRLIQHLAASRLPLPVSGLTRTRSIISLDNLVDAIMTVIGTGNATTPSGRFLVADPQPISLRDCISLLRQGMELPERIFSLPEPLLRTGLTALGKRSLATNLLGRLEIDASGFRDAFGWEPKLSAAEGIVKSGREFLAARRG